MPQQPAESPQFESLQKANDLGLLDLVQILIRNWRQVLGISFAIGALAFAGSFLIAPQFTAKTSFIPPQGSGGQFGAALASLGPLASLASGSASKGSGEMYVALLQSETIADRLIERFKLRDLYKAQFQFEARDHLKSRSHIIFSKRDGLITLEIDDASPERAAQIANQYVDELRAFTAGMTLTDAQRRRAFFEEQLKQSRAHLTDAQNALQGSGFNQGALRAEPKAAAEEYGRVKAELATTEVRLQGLKSRLADGAPEIAQLAATASALRRQLASLEQKSEPNLSQDYIGKYREFKYQESLFEQLSKQFEAARLEESREDASIQVVDRAQVPEWKSAPKRASIGLAAFFIAALVMSAFVIARDLWRAGAVARSN